MNNINSNQIHDEIDDNVINHKNNSNDKTEEMENLQKEINSLKNENIQLKNKLKKYEYNIIEKDEIIEKLKLDNTDILNKLKYLQSLNKSFDINNKNTELMTVIFTSLKEDFYYSIICKPNDKFSVIEEQLYQYMPELNESHNSFLIKGKNINRFKTISQNGIKFSDIVIVNPIKLIK